MENLFNTDYQLPVWAETTMCIIAIVLITLTWLLIILGCVFYFVYEVMTIEKRKQFVRTLDEHDRSVVSAYQSVKVISFKKRNKPQGDKYE